MPGLKFSNKTKLNKKKSSAKKGNNVFELTPNFGIKENSSINRRKSDENRTKNT